MDEDQQFCLRWNNHQSTLISVFDTLLEKGTLVDCTLAAEGQFLKAHKVVLSACSPYFAALLTQQYDKHPIFILKDVKFQELRAMMDYMYRGEVNISQDQLAALLKAAESLQIKGLSDSSGGRNNGTQSKDSLAASKAKGSGLTIEKNMPRGAAAGDMDAELSEAHDGSASPNAKKRKRARRRSIETNNVDNHDHHSNSSSHSMPHGGAAATQQQSQPQQQTASTMPTNITSATSSANVLSVTKKTDQEMMKSDVETEGNEDQQNRPAKDLQQRQNNGGRKSLTGKAHKDDMIEPKNEYDESNEETVEDLTLDEEEMMEELDQAGPSHGGESSSQGYPQWPVDRSQDNDSFMPGQDGHQRDAQAKANTKPQRIIPSGGVASPSAPSAISSTTAPTLLNTVKTAAAAAAAAATTPLKVPSVASFGNNGVAKKTTKNHPRIKYSIKFPTVPGQPTTTAHSMASLVSSFSTAPVIVQQQQQQQLQQPKSELLNFTLSRKYGKLATAEPFVQNAENLITAPPQGAIIKAPAGQLYIQQPVEQKPMMTEELQTNIISDLSQYEIEDIELNPYPYQDAAVVDAIDRDSQSGTMYRMSGEEDSKCSESNEMKFSVLNETTDDSGKSFECRHCGKKYRWKSTLRRHENVECGGKEPSYQCPHCSYKAKQRGNLGVHIRKHHSELPQLESRRKRQSL